jgi:hypothetical protein
VDRELKKQKDYR